MDDNALLEQIDACRGDADELRAEGLAPLAERIATDEHAFDLHRRVRHTDAAITSALRDVDVPADLAERLLVALKAARLDDVDVGSGVTVQAPASCLLPTASCADEQETTGTTCVARRAAPRYLSVPRLVAALSVAAACLALCFMYLQRPRVVSAEEIWGHVQIVYETEVVADIDAAPWSTAADSEAASSALDFLHANYRTIHRARWLRVGGYEAVAYDLLGFPPQRVPPQLPRRVTLFVIERRVTGLEFTPPLEPFNTQGRCVGVWQSDRHVYALVVEGTEEQYRGVLQPAHSII